ncbi:MAG: LysR family transcriptional regulator [Gammaproteobacteria bacterium]|nr:MAG: LysR family transcriptional regulator [Gammaproteobacteria bacterium]
MHVTFRQMQVFESAARHLSYTRAAEELFLSQPAVSMQIKQLEENLGIALFEKLGKKIYLTEAGREFFTYSKGVSQQLNEAEEVLEDLKGVTRGRLSVSVASTANYFATRLLADFFKAHEGVTVHLDVTNRKSLLSQLESNEVDMVIMGRPPADMELETSSFADNPLVIIAPPDHPLSRESRIQLEQLQQETFVVREIGSGTRIAMERFFTEKGIRLTTGMEMTSNEAIKQAVSASLGLGIVSIHTLSLELETKRLVVLNVEAFPILRHWYIVHRKGKRLSPVAKAFKQFVLENAKDVVTRLALPG